MPCPRRRWTSPMPLSCSRRSIGSAPMSSSTPPPTPLLTARNPNRRWPIASTVTVLPTLAMAGSRRGARIIHLSTDYVFDGAQREPYPPDAACHPAGVYGASKRAGELAVLEHGGAGACVVRTSWVYSSTGSNFVRTMLRLMAERTEVRVVDDQHGRPTWADGLARALWSLARRPSPVPIAHWTDAGSTTWHGFAEAIHEGALSRGLLTRRVAIHAIPTAEYPTPAARPLFSVLDVSSAGAVFGQEPVHWRDSLSLMLEDICSAA